MRPDKLSLFEIFGKDKRYLVPLFQRQYVWNRDDQWIPLWEDIRSKTLAVMERSSRGPHFLGALVLSQLPVYGKQISADEIIDGQQRLTTMQLLLAAFRDIAHSRGAAEYERDLGRQTAHECVMEDPEVERFKVWPTSADQAHFTRSMTAGSKDTLEHLYPSDGKKGALQRPRIVDAYCYFFDAVNEFLDDREVLALAAANKTTPIDGLFETLRNHLHFVIIALEQGDDAQIIFETLNARGQPLLPSDLIRNFVFLRAKARLVDSTDRGQGEVERLYNQYWRQYDERPDTGPNASPLGFWKHEEKQGRLKRPRIDLFIHHYVQYRSERETSIGHVFQEFRRWWSAQERDVEQELKALRDHAAEFGKWLVPTGSTPVDIFTRRLNVLDVGTVYPLLLYLVTDAEPVVDDQEFVGMLTDIESYLVRRAICGLTTQNYNRFFLVLLRELRKADRPTRGALRAQLASGTGDSVRWPDDAELAHHWLHQPAYRALGPALVEAILESLERSMRSSASETEPIFAPLTVEHVMPQAWREEEWPLPQQPDAEMRRQHLIHTFGNLTLLTMPLNGKVRNRAFSVKREEIRKKTLLELNREIIDAPRWDEETIVARGKQLFERARLVWPHINPGTPVGDTVWAERDWKPQSNHANSAGKHMLDLEHAKELLGAFLSVRRHSSAACAPGDAQVAEFARLLAEFRRLGGSQR